MRRRLLAVVSALATTFALSGAVVASATTKSPISIQIRLSKTNVVPGVPIRGTAILTNASRKAILVDSCASDGWLFVGLMNKSISFNPAVASVFCAPSIVLRPGANRFSIVLSTRYQNCVPTSAERCPPPPALPKGRYRTSVVIIGLPKGTPAAPRPSVTVT